MKHFEGGEIERKPDYDRYGPELGQTPATPEMEREPEVTPPELREIGKRIVEIRREEEEDARHEREVDRVIEEIRKRKEGGDKPS